MLPSLEERLSEISNFVGDPMHDGSSPLGVANCGHGACGSFGVHLMTLSADRTNAATAPNHGHWLRCRITHFLPYLRWRLEIENVHRCVGKLVEVLLTCLELIVGHFVSDKSALVCQRCQIDQ